MLMTKHKRLRQFAGIAETANVLWLRLLLKDRIGARVYPNSVFATYMSLGGSARWKCRSIFDFLPEISEKRLRITLEHLPGEGMTTPINELAFMAMVAGALAPRQIFEIGTYRGRTALNFALNSPDDCTIYTLDLPDESLEAAATVATGVDRRVIRSDLRIVGTEYRNTDVSHKIHQLYGNSLEFDFSPYYGEMDLVFVDGGHAYHIAASDTAQALKLCRPGGIILWHDFANYGEFHDVTRAVLDHIPGDQVVQLENSWLAAYRKPGSSRPDGSGSHNARLARTEKAPVR
jgi:predicted O-methyltransferase YrrM